MVKIGITGGIGSGKSTVCDTWKSLGAYVINADDVAKDIMINNPGVKQQIKATFGDQSYNADGQLNRAYLAEQAFEKGRVEELNAIVHPLVPGEVEHIMENASEHGYEVVVYEAALLLQNLRPDYLDAIVLVLADKSKRLERVTQRDGANKEQVLDRMNKQQDFEQLKNQADFIIENDGTLQALRKRAEQVMNSAVNAYKN